MKINNNISEEDILYDISSNFLKLRVQEQIDQIFTTLVKINFFDIYIKKYKMLKKEETDSTYLEQIKYNKDKFVSDVFKTIVDKYKIQYNDVEIKTVLVKSLYNIFVINYIDVLSEFIVTAILKNKKLIIRTLKELKNTDISYTSIKSKCKNTNDAIIIANINYIIFEIIPELYVDNSYMKIILSTDDDISLYHIDKAIDDNTLIFTSKSYKAFLKPLIKKEEGYMEIIVKVISSLLNIFKREHIDILE